MKESLTGRGVRLSSIPKYAYSAVPSQQHQIMLSYPHLHRTPIPVTESYLEHIYWMTSVSIVSAEDHKRQIVESINRCLPSFESQHPNLVCMAKLEISSA